jgi:Holliday junction resolvase RusA-like endonuclease
MHNSGAFNETACAISSILNVMSQGHPTTPVAVGRPFAPISMRIEMVPTGQERAGRVVRVDNAGRARVFAFTQDKTRRAVDHIRHAWMEAGSPKVPDGVPFDVSVRAIKHRPGSHLRKGGAPSAAWREIPRTPDVDNILKLVLDALQPVCFPNDALCRTATVSKSYGDGDRIEVRITP